MRPEGGGLGQREGLGERDMARGGLGLGKKKELGPLQREPGTEPGTGLEGACDWAGVSLGLGQREPGPERPWAKGRDWIREKEGFWGLGQRAESLGLGQRAWDWAKRKPRIGPKRSWELSPNSSSTVLASVPELLS